MAISRQARTQSRVSLKREAMDFIETRRAREAAAALSIPKVDTTLRLPAVVNVPANAGQGDSFNADFQTFTYRGETALKIGAVRKASYVLWSTPCITRACRLDAITKLPQSGGKIGVAKLNKVCLGCKSRKH